MELKTTDIVIVIPVYKKVAASYELFSLRRLVDVTKYKYDIVFVKPTTLTNKYMKQYYDAMPDYDGHVTEMTFDKSYFTSTTAYSNLCKTLDFYACLSTYKYMLIYQLDCYLVYDDILSWANMDYTYIGAPIVGINSGWRNIPYVGNGGFSLRNIQTFCYITNPHGQFLSEFNDDIKNENNEGYEKYEDLYFAELISSLWTGFSKPNYKLAGKFAWDRNPDALYKAYDKELPMGLHGWHNYIDFYKDKIDIPQNIIDDIKNGKI